MIAATNRDLFREHVNKTQHMTSLEKKVRYRNNELSYCIFNVKNFEPINRV